MPRILIVGGRPRAARPRRSSRGASAITASRLDGRVVLVVTFGFGAIGWVDDYRKVVYRNPKGL